MRIFICLFFTLVFANPALAVYNLKNGDIQISDFEFYPNSLGGNIGVYGAIKGSGYDDETAYSGNKAYKLLFAEDVLWNPEYEQEYEKAKGGLKKVKATSITHKLKRIDWAVFMLDMGPILDDKVQPVKIQPIDISKFRYFVFWIRGSKGGERFRIYFRDIHANTYKPQLKLEPNIAVTKRWKAVAVGIRRIARKIDIKNIAQIGIGFGMEDGNNPGNVLYVDNFILVK